ncbi:uncharacterized protein MELLADRAFT_89393 [Melampsora larici-populina 98AG31]|uniref:GCM domain-containing protein n=1 Tax=Melampsora larici-populina (strain 98AG31 / pathotype 3-4-7) TaxID=747676 RepID=F4R612_MELLP|nr:uncharacterized protein MELLADRAFT_89393 [Melampsora larici-populina 98AG31]EGG12138.1 hypothetical protein MELLADRAFT_89393 [Melampsora larici-populina 98AG31]
MRSSLDNPDSDNDGSYHEEVDESSVNEKDDKSLVDEEDGESLVNEEDFINEADKALHSDSGDSEVCPQTLQPQFYSKESKSKTTITTNVKPETRGVKGQKKTFALPLDRQSFQTSIHEEATVDDKGYPLLPNGDTVYVKQEDQDAPTNWGTFAFAYTTSGDGKDKAKRKKRPTDWQTKRKGFVSRPQICKAARCHGVLSYIPCHNTLCRMDEHTSGWGIIRHSGIHDHQWPRRSKPEKLSLDKFGKRVIANPEMGPLRHKVGRAPAGQKNIDPASNIHPAFGHLHRTGYYRRRILVTSGVIPEAKVPGAGDSFVMDMCHWGEHGLLERSSSFKPRDAHMTFQTEWMTQQLLSRDEDKNVYSGGLLSDVTYKFFLNSYLLSTSMYHEDLRRWIPIQFTWLKGLTEEHYASHFKTLMKQIKEADMTQIECDTLVRQVVDFSAAQKNGFIIAYMDVFKETDRAVALDKLKGCEEHFRAQVTRVKRNRNIIPVDDEGAFDKQARELMKQDKPGGMNFDQKIAQMRKDFPKAKRWLEWWTAADIKSMLFKSRTKRIDDDGLCDDMPATTNAQESLHRVYYMITETVQ